MRRPAAHEVPTAPGSGALRREAAGAFAILALAASIFTWPLALHLDSAIPAGGGPPTVALLGQFSMEWTGQALGEGRPYWDAPIFHPHRGTFAWSETQPATAIAVSALSRVSGPIAAYDLVLWLYLASFGLGGYLLARQVTADRLAALWASLWIVGGTYTTQQLGVLHLLAGGFPLACLAALLALSGDLRWRWAWAAGAAYLLTFLTCAQYGLLLTLLLPVAVLPALAAHRGRRRGVVLRLAPLVAGLLLASPWLLAQRARLDAMGFERSLVNVSGALLPGDLVLPARGHWLAGRIFGWSQSPDAYPWDLGLVPLLAVAAAAALGGFRRGRLAPPARGRAGALSLLAIAALLLGFGPNLSIPVGAEEIVPYAWLHAVVPGLSGVRTPARFAMFAVAAIAALAAVALAFLRRRAATPVARRALTGAAFGLLLAEIWALPIALAEPAMGVGDHRRVLGWLAGYGRGEPLIELPMSEDDSEAALEREVRAMQRALWHRSPIVNGYSGYFPEPFRQLRWALAEDPGGRGRRYLAALGVRLVLVHRHLDPPEEPERWLEALGGEVAFRDARDLVLHLPRGETIEPLRPPASTPRYFQQPRAGDILAVPIAPDPAVARFFDATSVPRLRVLWTDAAGLPHTTEVRLGGTVLVDARRPALHVFLQRMPSGGGPGRAVLLSEERVTRRRRDRWRAEHRGAARGRGAGGAPDRRHRDRKRDGARKGQDRLRQAAFGASRRRRK